MPGSSSSHGSGMPTRQDTVVPDEARFLPAASSAAFPSATNTEALESAVARLSGEVSEMKQMLSQILRVQQQQPLSSGPTAASPSFSTMERHGSPHHHHHVKFGAVPASGATPTQLESDSDEEKGAGNGSFPRAPEHSITFGRQVRSAETSRNASPSHCPRAPAASTSLPRSGQPTPGTAGSAVGGHHSFPARPVSPLATGPAATVEAAETRSTASNAGGGVGHAALGQSTLQRFVSMRAPPQPLRAGAASAPQFATLALNVPAPSGADNVSSMGSPAPSAPKKPPVRRKWTDVLKDMKRKDEKARAEAELRTRAASGMFTGDTPRAASEALSDDDGPPELVPQTTTVDFLGGGVSDPLMQFDDSGSAADDDDDVFSPRQRGHPRTADDTDVHTSTAATSANVSSRRRTLPPHAGDVAVPVTDARSSDESMQPVHADAAMNSTQTSPALRESQQLRRRGTTGVEEPLLETQSPLGETAAPHSPTTPLERKAGGKSATVGGGASAGAVAPQGSRMSSLQLRDRAIAVEPQWIAPVLDGLAPYALRTRSPVSQFADVLYVISATVASMIAVFPVHLYADGDHDRGSPIPGMPAGSFEIAVAFALLSQTITITWTVMRLIDPIRSFDDPWSVARAPRAIWNTYTSGAGLKYAVFDLVMAFPIEWIFMGWRWDLFFDVHLRHFLRVGRFYSFGTSNDPLTPVRHRMRLFCFAVVWLLVIHCIACGFWAVEPHMTYENAVYWTFTTLSTVGYGDIVPTPQTRPYACMTMVISMCMVAALTAYATMVLTKRDARREREDDAKSHMHAMLTYYNLPEADRRRVTSYFPSLLEADHEEQFRTLVAGLPEKERERIVSYVHARSLRTIDLFADVPHEDVLELSACLDRRLYPTGAEIFAQGDPGNEMYFLTRGAAEIIRIHPKALEPVRISCPRVFGEMALLENCTRSAWVVASCPCEVLVLSRDKFDSAVKRNESLFQVIKGIAERRKMENRRHATAQAMRFIRDESFFRNLNDDAAVQALAEHLDPEIAEAGMEVLKQGHKTDSLYFVVVGTAEAVLEVESGQFMPVAQFHRGTIFGEMELITGEICAATVRAVSRLELLRLSRDNFELIRSENKGIECLMRFLGDLRRGGVAEETLVELPDDISQQWTAIGADGFEAQ